MKLVKNLLIPGVALISLFSVSFAEGSIICNDDYDGGCRVNFQLTKPSKIGDCIVICNDYDNNLKNCNGGYYNLDCQFPISNINLSDFGLFGINKDYYYIKNQLISKSSVNVYSDYYYNLGYDLNGVVYNNISSNIVNNILNFGNKNGFLKFNRFYIDPSITNEYIIITDSNDFTFFDLIDFSKLNFEYIVYNQSINYVDFPAISQNSSGEYFIGGVVNNKIGQGTSQGFSNLLHFIIQFLPLMIFVFIIGYIIRKILIRFGMLKGPDGKISTSIPKNNILNRKKYRGVVKK